VDGNNNSHNNSRHPAVDGNNNSRHKATGNKAQVMMDSSRHQNATGG
jgi:hypothetical protein